MITVSGSFFVDSPTIQCTFGGTRRVPASFESTTMLFCTTPAGKPGFADVQVSFHHEETPSAMAQFLYWPDAVIARIFPSFGLVSIPTVITIYGSNFRPSFNICLFGNKTDSKLEFFTSSRLGCRLPSSLEAQGTLEVGFRSGWVTSSNHLFRFEEGVTISKLVPSNGPEMGGTVVTVHGNFLFREGRAGIVCRSASCQYIASSMVACILPPATRHGSINVSCTRSGFSAESNALVYRYEATPEYQSCMPSIGPIHGGTLVTVTVHSTSFATNTSWKCLFGTTRVHAEQKSESLLWCISPPAEVGDIPLSIQLAEDGSFPQSVYHPAKVAVLTYALMP